MNILIVHTAFIGDIVLATALVSKLKNKYPDSNIYFLTTPLGKEVLKNNPKIKNIIVYDKNKKDKGIKAFFRMIKDIRALKIDVCITPHRYLRSSLLTFFSGAKIRIGYDIANLSFIYNKKIKYDKTKHEVEKLLSFIDDKCSTKNERYELELYPVEENKIKIDSFLKDYREKELIVIAPGSKWHTKKWPAEYFKKLIKNLSLRDEILLVITGGNEEKEIELELPKNTLDLRGEINLLDLAELCKRAKIVVSNDSAPIHIASAFRETRVLGIFGPTVREFGFFPWSINSEVLEVNGLYCRPCAIHGGKKCPEEHFRCMKEILPEFVEEKILKYLENIRSKVGD